MKNENDFIRFVTDTSEIFRRERGKNLKISYRAKNLSFTDEMMNFIDIHWEKAKKKWPGMFNGKLYHVLKKEICKQEVLLDTIDSNYKEYVGTREPEFARLFGSSCVVSPLSVGTLVVTVDNKLLLGRRKFVDTWEGFYSTVAGYVQLPRSPKSPPEAIETLRQELFEEAAIDRKEISSFRFLGSVGKSYLVFEVSVEISSSTLLVRQPTEKEFAEFEFLQNDRESIREFIKEKKFKTMPGYLASLIFFGIHHFGEEWVSKFQ